MHTQTHIERKAKRVKDTEIEGETYVHSCNGRLHWAL